MPLPIAHGSAQIVRAFVAVLIASTAALAHAEDSAADGVPPQSAIKKELLSEFKFEAPPKETAPKPPFLSPAASQGPADPLADTLEVVRMEPYTVRENVKMEALHASILQQKTDARNAAIASKLGIGVNVVPVGDIYLFDATIFHIPFVAGFGFAW